MQSKNAFRARLKKASVRVKNIAVLTGVLYIQSAQAHYLWLEAGVGQARLYFGEYQEGVREQVGGRLDAIAHPQVQTWEQSKKPVELVVERQPDHLAIMQSSAMPLIAQELSVKVQDLRKNKIGIVKPMYYARLAAGTGSKTTTSETLSPLVLDIQPVGAGRLRVNFQGKPLAQTALILYAPNQWLREYKTNDNGEVNIETPWPGLYVAEVIFIEPTPGVYQQEAYELVRHVSTLSQVYP